VGGCFVGKSPKPKLFASNFYTSHPLVPSLVPANAFHSAALAKALCLIRPVLRLSAWPKIFSGVVAAIVIFVIVLSGLWKSCALGNDVVHVDARPPTVVFYYISHHTPVIAIRKRFFVGVPLELRKEFVIFSRDDGELGLCERNEASIVVHVGYLDRPVLFDDEPACLPPIQAELAWLCNN
jgi:hypothetical protein